MFRPSLREQVKRTLAAQSKSLRAGSEREHAEVASRALRLASSKGGKDVEEVKQLLHKAIQHLRENGAGASGALLALENAVKAGDGYTYSGACS